MLIEQIIEFELRGPGPYLLLKYCTRQCTLISPIWAQSLTKFNPKMQDFKRFLDLNCE